MQNPVFYGAFLAISWIKPRSVVTNYSECMRSNSAYRDAYVTWSQTQSLVCLWFQTENFFFFFFLCFFFYCNTHTNKQKKALLTKYYYLQCNTVLMLLTIRHILFTIRRLQYLQYIAYTIYNTLITLLTTVLTIFALLACNSKYYLLLSYLCQSSCGWTKKALKELPVLGI